MELKPEQLAARGTSEPLLPVYLIAGPETLRVLDALQTDELCPCNWNKGDDVLKIAA